MASPAQQEKPSAQVIGQAFAEQYYTVLHQSPSVVYRFYQDISKLGRPVDGGIMDFTTGMNEIDAKIQSYGTLKAEIKTVDAQESYNGGVVVLVTGCMVKEEDRRQGFTQTFFLAPQEVGYFVLTDIFRYVDEGQPETESEELSNGIVEPAAPQISDEEAIPVQHVDIVDQPEEVNGGEVCDPSDDGEGSTLEQEELEPVAEVVNEVPLPSAAVLESESKSEDAPKKTYASIVKVMKESAKKVPAPVKSVPKTQQVSAAPPQVSVAAPQVSIAPPPVPVTEKIVANSTVAEDSGNQDAEVEGFSIYLRNLPVNSGPVVVEEAFKEFGVIKRGGVQVRNNKGFCFGFVEYETLEAAQNAIEAGSVVIGGRQVYIEEKKSTNSGGGNRGRFPQGRGGGFRNEGGPRGGGRGGSYGGGRGRGGYGRGEFVRNDYRGNNNNGRGGGYHQSRNLDTYQKVEMGNGGGNINSNRVNGRGGGSSANGAVDRAQRVPTTA